jgi:hypothetical protein
VLVGKEYKFDSSILYNYRKRHVLQHASSALRKPTSKFRPKIALLCKIVITMIGSKTLYQLPFCAHNKVHFLTLYLLHFPTFYLLSNLHLGEGRANTSWNPSGQAVSMHPLSLLYSPPLCRLQVNEEKQDRVF